MQGWMKAGWEPRARALTCTQPKSFHLSRRQGWGGSTIRTQQLDPGNEWPGVQGNPVLFGAFASLQSSTSDGGSVVHKALTEMLPRK